MYKNFDVNFPKLFKYIGSLKSSISILLSNESIKGFIYFGIYKFIYNTIYFSDNYMGTNQQTNQQTQTDKPVKKLNISLNSFESLDNLLLYDISIEDITIDDMLQIEDKNRNNIGYIDKGIQCELNIEEMVNIGDLEIKYTVSNDMSKATSRYRWFF